MVSTFQDLLLRVELSSADRGWSLRCFPLLLRLITGVGLQAHLAALLPQLHSQQHSDKMTCRNSDRLGQLTAKFSMWEGNKRGRREEKRKRGRRGNRKDEKKKEDSH